MNLLVDKAEDGSSYPRREEGDSSFQSQVLVGFLVCLLAINNF